MNLMKLNSTFCAAVACLALVPGARSQTTPGSMLYTPITNLAALPQNTFVGTVGGIFLSTYSFYPQVNCLGYADPTGAPLTDAHLVSLWDNNPAGGGQSLLASAMVPAGTAAPLVNGYRWVMLPSTINLTYGHYYVIGAQTDGVDLWGNLIANLSPDPGSNGGISWSAQYAQLGSGWEFSRAGRYDSASNYPNEPPNQTSVQDSIYSAPNLGYFVIPEPSSLGLLGLGLVFVLKRKVRG